MKLVLEKVNYNYKDLDPIMSKDTLIYHRDNLAKSYVKRFNAGEGDSTFNEAGAFLHNLFFPQFKKPGGQNKPSGACKEFIDENFENFDSFKEELASVAMSIQGSGWAYLARDGKVKTIKNHQIKNDIILLIDWWEHAWALDYQSDKRAYLKNIWKIIDWDVINERLNLIKQSRFNRIAGLMKSAETSEQEFRRWLADDYQKKEVDWHIKNRLAYWQRFARTKSSRAIRHIISNSLFKKKSDEYQAMAREAFEKSREEDGRINSDFFETFERPSRIPEGIKSQLYDDEERRRRPAAPLSEQLKLF